MTDRLPSRGQRDLYTLLDFHLEALSETDLSRRPGLIALVWAEDGRLIDPPRRARGRGGILKLTTVMQLEYPNCRFRRVGGVDRLERGFQVAWELIGADGTAAVAGVDTGELAADGRLGRVTRRVTGVSPPPRRVALDRGVVLSRAKAA
jgi:hypothetical protein